jgi:hypothetical protein
MALKFIEGFDDGLLAQRAWTSVETTTGRFGGSCGRPVFFGQVTYSFPAPLTGTVVFGFACLFTAVSAYSPVLQVGSALIGRTAGGSVTLSNGGSLVGTSPSAPFSSANVWRYIELKYVLSTGACTVRVDGVAVITATVGTAASISSMLLGQGGGNAQQLQFDDFYVLDTTGTKNNDFLGDVRIQTLLPTADGTHSDLAPSTGTAHAALVDEPAPNTTDYVYSASAGMKDTYQFQDLAATTANIFGVEITNYSRKDATGSVGVANVSRVAGVDYTAVPQGLSASWTANRDLLELNPATGLPWAPADVINSEFGIKTS